MSGKSETANTREPITSGTRSNIVDIVKGLAIILVVYGHTAQGLIHRAWWTGPEAAFSETFIYSFHMPAFFFVAGLFVTGSIAKRGGQAFVVDKLKTILYPYVLFTLINPLIEPLIGRFKSSTVPFQWRAFFESLLDGDSSWFLFVLFFSLMLALLTIRVPAWLRFFAAVVVALLPLPGLPAIGRVLHEFCFLAAGMWFGTRVYRLEKIRWAPAVLGLILLTAFQLRFILTYGYSALWLWPFVILGLTGTAGLFLLARLVDRSRLGDSLAWIGRASLAIFLLSAFAQGATREVLIRVFHTREIWLQIIVPTFFATLLPAVVWYQQDRWRLSWLFRWPF
jgi:fucose 4-O-acetylase-like acetyltransferase